MMRTFPFVASVVMACHLWLKDVKEFLSAMLKACLQKARIMGYEQTYTLSERPDRRSVGTPAALAAPGPESRPPAHRGPAGPPGRHLLHPAHRLPVAAA